MKTPIFFLFFAFTIVCVQAQVGIGTTDPKAALDIRASSTAAPSNLDGILIPKIDEFPASNPTAVQDGMMVYATGSGAPGKGFYYWNNSLGTWVSVSGVKKIDDLTDGKSDVNGNSIFLGINAGANDNGSFTNQNIGIGKDALNANISGFSNVAIGHSVLRYNTANNNIGIGSAALNANTTGQSNTGIGYRALVLNTTGRSNMAIGTSALSQNVDGNYNMAIGSSALDANVSGEENIAIGNSSQVFNTAGTRNVSVGINSLANHTTGDYNTAIGWGAGRADSGDGGVFIGYAAGYNETNPNRLYIENSINSSPLIFGDFGSNEVGINWPSATALPNTLSVNGSASKSTSGSWLANSDRRLKKDIETINPKEALEKLTQLRGVTYLWNDTQTGLDRPTTVQYGFIAQEIMNVFPDKVTQDGQGFYQTAYGDYDALFVQALKALKAQLESKDKKIDELETNYQILSEQVKRLEKKIEQLGEKG